MYMHTKANLYTFADSVLFVIPIICGGGLALNHTLHALLFNY